MASISNMQMSDGNIRVAAAGYIGARTGIIIGIAGEGPVAGIRNASPRPMAISRFRMAFAPVAAFGTPQGVAFEAHITNCTANFSGGSPITVLAQRRKTSGYTAIPESEIDVKVSNTGALSGGTHVNKEPGDSPWLGCGNFGASPACEVLWESTDGAPLVLEQNEGLLVHNLIIMGATGSGYLFLGIDFYRF